jgi:hypothetical protein
LVYGLGNYTQIPVFVITENSVFVRICSQGILASITGAAVLTSRTTSFGEPSQD